MVTSAGVSIRRWHSRSALGAAVEGALRECAYPGRRDV
jgi:hypothetical protein